MNLSCLFDFVQLKNLSSNVLCLFCNPLVYYASYLGCMNFCREEERDSIRYYKYSFLCCKNNSQASIYDEVKVQLQLPH